VTGATGTPTRPTVRWARDLDEPVVAMAGLSAGAVVAGSEGTVLVLDAEGELRATLALDDQLLAMAPSPDGTRLVAGGGSCIRMWDLRDGQLMRHAATGWCAALAWTHRSDRVAVADGRQVRVVDRDGSRCWTSPLLASTCTGLVWVRGERRVAAAAYRGVSIFEPATDRLVEHLAAPGSIAGLAAAPNGRWVVGGSQDATLHGWKVPGGDDFRMSGFPNTVSTLAFEPSGRWMACDGGPDIACWDFSGRGPTGREALLLTGHQNRVTAWAWRHSGQATGSIELFSGDVAGGLAAFRVSRGDGPGARLRPVWTEATGDSVTALAAMAGGMLAGHRSGAVVYRPTG
jgi:WD40 repeat protein